MKQRLEIYCSYTLVVVTLAAYYLLYFDRYFPITEGWFSTYGHLIRMGQVPYRDFFLLLPPLYPYKIAAFQALFGESLIGLRYLGLIITCAIGVVLFEILRTLFNRWVSAFAACIALVYYQSGNAYLGYDFTQFLTLYLLLGTMCLMKYCDHATLADRNRRGTLLFLCGMFLALAVLIKHSNGSLGALAVLISAIIVVLRCERRPALTRRLLSLAGGFAAPLLLTLGWLAYIGLLTDAASNLFIAALQAKGGPHATFVNWLKNLLAERYLFHTRKLFKRLLILVPGIIALSCFLGIMIDVRRYGLDKWNRSLSLQLVRADTQDPRLGRFGLALLLLGFVCLVGIISSIYHGIHISQATTNLGMLVRSQIVIGSTNLYIIGGLVALVLSVWQLRAAAAKYFIVFALGIGLIVGNGTSGGLSEISSFLGLSIVLAYILGIASRYALPLLIPLWVFLSLATVLIDIKFSSPYYWWAVTSPDIRTVTCAPTTGILKGLCVDPSKKSKIDQIINEITAQTHENDQIYIYPHIPIFHLLTGRPPYSKAPVSWFDFMSDDQALYVSRELLSDPPPLLIVADLPETVMEAHERLFRGGKQLGQREILRSIYTLESKHIIKKVKTVTDVDGLNIIIYAKMLTNNLDLHKGETGKIW
jgi:Dolichyl-phosphate-mannose-protein mannosyltransferase